MESIEQRLDRIEFYQKLLMEMINDHHYEFYRLIIEKKNFKKKKLKPSINFVKSLVKRVKSKRKTILFSSRHFIKSL